MLFRSLDNVGNIALLQRAEAAGLLPPGVGQAAANAYRALRLAQHRARLDERPTQFALPEPVEAALATSLPAGAVAQAPPNALPSNIWHLPDARAAVLALWQAVFA